MIIFDGSRDPLANVLQDYLWVSGHYMSAWFGRLRAHANKLPSLQETILP